MAENRIVLRSPGQRGVEVRFLDFEPRSATRRSSRTVQLRAALLGEGEEVLGVSPAGSVQLIGFGEPIQGEQAQGLEQPVPRRCRRWSRTRSEWSTRVVT